MRYHAVILVTLILLIAGRAAAEPATDSHTRGLTRPSRDLIDEGRTRSSIVRSLIEALDAADVVVYVSVEPMDLPGSAHLAFLTCGADTRYLLVRINTMANRTYQVAMLGHELQHALEVAAAKDVRDFDTFVALYQRIGWRTEAGGFETERARQTGWLVQRELTGLSATR
jgi:hypothetical protein